jgi:hypothetical protein
MAYDWSTSGTFTGFNPVAFSLPKIAGMDLSYAGKGKRDVVLFDPNAPASQTSGAKPTPTGIPNTGEAIPSTASIFDQQSKFLEQLYPLERQRRIEETQLAAELTRQQMADLMPYLSAAGYEATARSLAASKSFGAFKEQLPSNVQNIMASKQAQATSAASAEAARQTATAQQQLAAKDFAGKFAGQYFSVS